jgi:type I restriction enzyme, S subunit
MQLNIDKTIWQKVQFGDVVQKKNNKINPNEYHSDIVIQGGHINKRDFHIRKFENKKELGYLGPAFHMGFKEGQILYVSRNPHLMKVGYPHFDGICANTTFIMGTMDKNFLRNDLIPFIMHSDNFIEQSIANVRGGVNPYVNWGDLACIEFLLPPKEQQAQLAKLLWAMDEVVERERKLLASLKTLLAANIEQEIHGIEIKNKVIREVLDEISEKIDLVPLSELGELLKGRGIPKSDVRDDGLPCVRYGELYTKHHRIIRVFNSFISEQDKIKSLRLKMNDILFAGSGETITEIGKSAAFVNDIEAYAGSDTLLFRPNDMDGHYLGYLMNSQIVRQQLNKYGTGATVMHIYNSDLAKVRIPKIDKETQESIGQKLETIFLNIIKTESKIMSSISLQKSIINQVFSVNAEKTTDN